MDSDKKILVVEDEQVIIESAKKIFSIEELAIDSAFDVTEALNKLQGNSSSYSMVITDLMLPKVSGMELVKVIREKYSKIPVIVFTGYATTDKAVEAITTGAFDFLPKPFSIEEMLGVVNRCLQYIQAITSGEYLNDFETEQKKISSEGESYFFGHHSWARFEEKNTVTIGVGKTFFRLIGNIKDVEFPSINEEVNQGNVCARIITENDYEHAVRIPFSGIVKQFNQEVISNKNLINSVSFSDGWLLKIAPTQKDIDLANVVKK